MNYSILAVNFSDILNVFSKFEWNYSTITMIISFAEVFADAGFQKYIVQHEFKDDKDFDDLEQEIK